MEPMGLYTDLRASSRQPRSTQVQLRRKPAETSFFHTCLRRTSQSDLHSQVDFAPSVHSALIISGLFAFKALQVGRFCIDTPSRDAVVL